MDYASELAEIITYQKYTFEVWKETLPEALKTEGIAFNEIEVYQTTLALLKYQIRKNLME
jgi:uroporphyrinogen-III synthase